MIIPNLTDRVGGGGGFRISNSCKISHTIFRPLCEINPPQAVFSQLQPSKTVSQLFIAAFVQWSECRVLCLAAIER